MTQKKIDKDTSWLKSLSKSLFIPGQRRDGEKAGQWVYTWGPRYEVSTPYLACPFYGCPSLDTTLLYNQPSDIFYFDLNEYPGITLEQTNNWFSRIIRTNTNVSGMIRFKPLVTKESGLSPPE